MQIEWIDVLKLTIPFVTTILMVWIKAWIENNLSRKNKQLVLSRLISDELSQLQHGVQVLKTTAEAAKAGKLNLASFDVSNLLSKFASDLSDLDAEQAYVYSDLISSIAIANGGTSRLSSLILSRANSKEPEISSRIERCIIGQTKITAIDFISFAESGMKVLNAIPRHIRYTDDQALNQLNSTVANAKSFIEQWPSPPPAAGSGEERTASIA